MADKLTFAGLWRARLGAVATLILVASIALVGIAFTSSAAAQPQDTDEGAPTAQDDASYPTAAGGESVPDDTPPFTGTVAAIPGFYPVSELGLGYWSHGLGLDPDTGYLWVANRSDDQIDIYSHAGVLVDSFGSPGTGPGRFDTPSGIEFAGGEVYIADYGNDRVQVFDTSGVHQRDIGGGVVDRPCGVEVLGNRLFVVSGSSDKVDIFTLAGGVVDSTDGSDSGTEFDFVCWYDSIATDGTDIYVADYENGRVVVLNANGDAIDDFSTGVGPSSIDIDDTGHLWLTNQSEHRLEQWTTDGTLIGAIDLQGSALGQIDGPTAVVVDPSGSAVWITEFYNERVQVFTNLECVGKSLTHVGTSYDDEFTTDGDADVVHLMGGNDALFASAGDDIVCAGSGTDVVYGEGGNDKLYGGGNSDRLYGGADDDLLRGGTRSDRLYGGEGTDTIYGDQHADLIYGGPDDDTIYGSSGADRLFGQGGADTIYGQEDNDKIYGGPGSDDLWGGDGNDRIWGETGHDDIWGNADNDSFLDGGDHNDRVYGGGGNDIVRGGDGRDKVHGNGGNDDVRAQAGDDWKTDGGPGTDNCQVAPEDNPGGDIAAINCE